MAGAEGSRSHLSSSQETGGHSAQLALPSGSFQGPGRFPVSINRLASPPQTYPKVCLLADY